MSLTYEQAIELFGDKAEPAPFSTVDYYQKNTPELGYILSLDTPHGYNGFEAELWFDRQGNYLGAAAWE